MEDGAEFLGPHCGRCDKIAGEVPAGLEVEFWVKESVV